MKHKALFLDRDGVINIDKGYVYKIEDFEFVDGIFELCSYYLQQGFLLFVVTNQSGIARGYYTEDDFKILTEWMLNQFKNRGIILTKVYYCADHPDFTGPSERRKPNPGMLLEAADEFELDLTQSVMIGDKESDREAARRAGLSYYINAESNQRIHLSDSTPFDMNK